MISFKRSAVRSYSWAQPASPPSRACIRLRSDASAGCPIGNLASELSDVHEGFRRRLAGIFTEWRATLTEALSRGQAGGRVRPGFEPSAVAQFLVAALEGAILLTKVTKDIGIMERCVEQLKHHLTLYTMNAESIQIPGAPDPPARGRTT